MSRANMKEVELDALIQYYEQHGLDEPLEIGRRIYKTLFGGGAVSFPLELLFDSNQRRQFCFPYELIANQGGAQLCLDTEGSLVRVLNKPATPELLTLPVNILIVIASPEGFDSLCGDLEIRRIREALGARFDARQPGTLRHPFATFRVIEGKSTMRQITEAIDQEQYHIVELIVHGDDYHGGKGGVVFFEDHSGGEEAIDGNRLYAYLAQKGHPPSIVILNSCLTGGENDPPLGQLSNVAWQLLGYGIPAVLAMQAKVGSELAARAGAAFYEMLFSPGSLDESVRAMRLNLGDKWYAPILATCRGFERQVFTEEWVRFLEQVSKINQEVAQLLKSYAEQRPNSYERLKRFVKGLEPEYYHLIHERDKVADIILEHVADELETSL